MASVQHTRVPCTLCSSYVSLRIVLYMGSAFYGLTVRNIRLYIALGSSVIGMMVYNVEKG